MKRIVWVVLLVLTAVAIGAFARTVWAQRGGQVTICHRGPGAPRRGQTIRVAPSAVPGHQAHGDTVGPCAASPVM